MVRVLRVITIVASLTALAHAAPPACDSGDSEDCTAKCDRGEADACGVLASMYALGDGVEAAPGKAAELANASCRARSPRGCVTLAMLQEIGVGVRKDEVAARTGYERACRDGLPYGCYRLASLYLAGHGVAVDRAKATELLHKACDADEQAACSQLAAAEEQADPAAAAQIWEKACTAGHARSCAGLGKLNEDGRGVAKNTIRARELYQRACDHHLWSICTYLAALNAPAATTGTKPRRASKLQSASKAVTLYTAACDHFDLDGCNGLGSLLLAGNGVGKDAAKAVKLFQRACDGKNKHGCANLGWAYTQGEGIEKNITRGKQMLDRACADHIDWACERAKTAELTNADRCEQLSGVEAGDCLNQSGLAYQAGASGIAKDTKRATTLFEQACGLASPAGCTNFGSALVRGVDIDRDAPRGLKLIKRACTTDKLVAACDYLKTLPAWAQGKPLPDYAIDGPVEHAGDGCARVSKAVFADAAAARAAQGKTPAAGMVARFTRATRPAAISDGLWKACTQIEVRWYREHAAEFDKSLADAEAREARDAEAEERREAERERSNATFARMKCERECAQMCRARSPGDACQTSIAKCKRGC